MGRWLRAGVSALLGLSGALMVAASWQRWAGACPWGGTRGGACEVVQDDRYEFVAPSAPWEPIGDAAQLAGWSLLVLALAFAVLPWALSGRRPGAYAAAAAVVATAAMVSVGVATLRSGLSGSAVDPFGGDTARRLWAMLPPVLLIRWAVTARGGPATSAAVLLLLASPLVAAFSYALGPYDAAPWWEAISGSLTAAAGACLLTAVMVGDRHCERRASTGPAPADGLVARAGGSTQR